MVVVSACSTVSGTHLRAVISLPVASSATSSRDFQRFSAKSPLGRWECARGICWSRTRAMEGVVEDKEVKDGAGLKKRAAVLASKFEVEPLGRLPSFLNARSGEEMLSCIRKEVEMGNLPLKVAFGMEELYHNYRNAVLQSGNPMADDLVLSNMAVALDRILLDVEDPFTFQSHHKAVREPFDYYIFGQNYIRPLINFRASYIGNISIFHEVDEKLQKGQNVILISNHQTEADPAVIALLLETTNPCIAEGMTYVAGDRVVTDPLCKPFSMGRNLICVYSKKHLYDIPHLAEMKKKANTRSLKAMASLLRNGGQIIWIAPSGGRDRPDPVTGEWYPAPFDASSVENLRRLAIHSGVEGHIYPLSLLCHDVMPPPPQVEKQIGEQRSVSFHGVGVSIGPEVKFEEIASQFETSEEGKLAFSQALYSSVTEQYSVLKSAIYQQQEGLKASNSLVSLSQPWI